jgi:hypothetical protein
MTNAELNPEMLTSLSALIEKIALELVFAEPGKDNGLLPINDLLGQMEALLVSTAGAEAIARATAAARQLLDGVFEGNGLLATGTAVQSRGRLRPRQSPL